MGEYARGPRISCDGVLYEFVWLVLASKLSFPTSYYIIKLQALHYYPHPHGQWVHYLVCVCVCVSVSYHKIAVKFNYLRIHKSQTW